MKHIKIFDTTLRDGEQSVGATLNCEEKIILSRQLSKLGVDIIEAGFPIASEDEFNAVKTVAENTRKPVITALCRAAEKDIDAAWKAVQNAKKPRLHVFIATSPIHMKYKLKMTPKETLEKAAKMVKYAKDYCADIEYSAEDTTRSDIDFVSTVYRETIGSGATTINICDTVGYETPTSFREFLEKLWDLTPELKSVDTSVHCHNDLGMAVANSLTAVLCGINQVECTINGIGERAGNASLEEIVMSLKMRQDIFNATTKIKSEHLYRTSKMVENLTGIRVQPHKAIVGANAFAHEAGIHQHGIISNQQTYEIIRPEDVGRKTELVIGKHSGKHAIEKILNENNIKLDKTGIEEITKKIKELADKEKKIETADILAIALDSHGKEKIKLRNLLVTTGLHQEPTASITISSNGQDNTAIGSGVGPVDAISEALEKATKNKIELMEYKIDAITGDTKALAKVYITAKQKGQVVSAWAVDKDIVIASAKCLVKVYNQLMLLGERND